ncbi:MAG: ABC transporter ATP-binding protein [Inquilinaceae bacterium]
MSTIELRSVTKRFGNFTAVKDVDLSVAAGEVVCLLGPSGCGKTTTLRMIAGLEAPTEGDVIVAGQRMNDRAPKDRDIAMVFQFYALYPALTVAENLAFPLHVERLSSNSRNQRVRSVAETLQLTHILDRKPNEIAEGEKQRVAVARAIIRDPNCFLFDEPLSRLDVELRESMRGQIKEVLQGLSKATLIVTHDQLEALTMADRITIMRDGLIEQIGTPHEVFAAPVNDFVASFIGTPQMNLIEGELVATRDDPAGSMAEIRIGDATIQLHVAPAVAGVEPGAVTLGVRPRAFSLAAVADPTAISADVELLEPMGAETLVHARSPSGADIRVVISRETRVKAGETLHLVPDFGQTHVFDRRGKAVR